MGWRAQSKKVKEINGDGIFNLSSQTLTKAETALLSKGLKFAPPKKLNKFQTYMDIHRFVCKVNIKQHFATNQTTQNMVAQQHFQHSGLSNASTINPPGVLGPLIEGFQGCTFTRFGVDKKP